MTSAIYQISSRVEMRHEFSFSDRQNCRFIWKVQIGFAKVHCRIGEVVVSLNYIELERFGSISKGGEFYRLKHFCFQLLVPLRG